MSKVIEIDLPTKLNTVTSEDQVIEIKQIYAQKKTLPKLYGVSSSTIFRLLKRAEENGFTDVSVSVSQTCQLVHLERFNEFLKSINKKHL